MMTLKHFLVARPLALENFLHKPALQNFIRDGVVECSHAIYHYLQYILECLVIERYDNAAVHRKVQFSSVVVKQFA